MDNFSSRLRDSRMEFKSIRSIALCAVLAGIGMVLSAFTIRISPSFEIGFSGVASAMIGLLFGPFMAPCAGIVTDILNYIANPNGGFFPGFTLTAMAAGFIRGTVTYHRPVTFRRLLISELLTAAVCSVGLNTLWLAIMYGRSTLLALPARIAAAAALAALNAFLVTALSKALLRAGLMPNVRK
ncbi:MAG: folate family ECF transporter S component [Eubacteriales bacterium]|nr:folate family ECF transporter S component [Eubacteriales bacterium]